jgi:hypothetical protein
MVQAAHLHMTTSASGWLQDVKDKAQDAKGFVQDKAQEAKGFVQEKTQEAKSKAGRLPPEVLLCGPSHGALLLCCLQALSPPAA